MSQENGREIIAQGARAGVLLPLALDAVFDYHVPDGMQLRAGDYVRVPFGRKFAYGVVWGQGNGEIDEKKIKSIESLCASLPPMSDAMRAFIDWAAWYTLAARGMVLKMAISIPEALLSPEKETRYRLTLDMAAKLTPSRARIVAYLNDGVARSAKEITTQAKTA